MSHEIILSADEPITCPSCGHAFPLREGIASQTIERYEHAYDARLAERERALREELAREAERRLARQHQGELAKLQEQLSERQGEVAELRARIQQAQEAARAKALADFAQERQTLERELAEQAAKLEAFRAQELALRQEKKGLEAARAELELQVQRRLDEERRQMEAQLTGRIEEQFRLREAEWQKKIADAQRANEELKRKLEQGSQQLQGEVLELELETLLRQAFPLDQIEPVSKGRRGADVVQTVVTRAGQTCGRIVWEAKRAENWSNAWLPKLKDDQREIGAEIAVLVSTVLPKQSREPFLMQDDVWVVTVPAVRPVAELLRTVLISAQQQRAFNQGRQEKMAALYDYLCSPQFAQKLKAVAESYAAMKKDLDDEKAAMARLWKKREMQLERVTQNVMGISGELQAIAQEALPQLGEVGLLPG